MCNRRRVSVNPLLQTVTNQESRTHSQHQWAIPPTKGIPEPDLSDIGGGVRLLVTALPQFAALSRNQELGLQTGSASELQCLHFKRSHSGTRSYFRASAGDPASIHVFRARTLQRSILNFQQSQSPSPVYWACASSLQCLSGSVLTLKQPITGIIRSEVQAIRIREFGIPKCQKLFLNSNKAETLIGPDTWVPSPSDKLGFPKHI